MSTGAPNPEALPAVDAAVRPGQSWFMESASHAGSTTAGWSADVDRPAVTPARTSWEWQWVPWLTVFGAACIAYGVIWDISWHSAIGRDTFWTPAHLLIHLGGLLGGLLGGWMILSSTFWRREEWRDRTVGILGFRGPLGSWVAVWGAVGMLTSAPFDNWWHDAYGLDVKILSPPHALLAAGMYAVVTGAMLMAVASRNRQGGTGGNALMLVAGGVQLSLSAILLTELSYPNLQRTAPFYLATAAMYPSFLCAVARQGAIRFAATTVAGIYALISMTMIWILPLFAAEPKLAPIFTPITHMVPPPFPLLLVVPALAIDLYAGWLRRWQTWIGDLVLAAGCALLFTAAFVPVHWWFSEFLLSPAADNAFFAGNRFFSFASRPSWRGEYWGIERNPVTPVTLGWTLLIALGSSIVGAVAGRFQSSVRR